MVFRRVREWLESRHKPLVSVPFDVAAVPARDGAVPPGEAIRLIIWDLDDTLWHGTLAEGSVRVRAEAVEVITTLARRGIVHSICSKNDFSVARAALEACDLWAYFVFPSIDWTPKGPRLAALLEAIQLRSETALFIDDNHGNRAEAQHYVPGLRVASENVVADLIKCALLRGKDDPGLDRLKQYRILQAKADATIGGGDNEAFLRASEIEISVEHDLDAHIDRVIELINRTNQLNFTKLRLPEEPEAARHALRETLASHFIKAGLVRVTDRYGDYGIVGFYMLHHQHAHPPRLVHFCFSCRILNMGVETWLYAHLGRPALKVSGEVLADPASDPRIIDWIAIGKGRGRLAEGPAQGPEYVLLRGGCDIHTIAHYFRFTGAQVFEELHSVRNGYEPTVSHSIMLRHAILGSTAGLRAAAAPFGYVDTDFTSRVAEPPPGSGIWLFSFAHDNMSMLYRFKPTQELLPVRSYRTPFLARTLIGGNPDELGLSAHFLEHLARDFEFNGGISSELFEDNVRLVFGHASGEIKIFVILGNELATGAGGAPRRNDANIARNDVIRKVAADFGHVTPIPVTDFVDDSNGPVLSDHFDRKAYYRLFKQILRQYGSDGSSTAV